MTPLAPPRPAPPRRVCLILEGTYPYVAGGVSTWVHQIIEAMPEIDFAVHYIGDQKQHNSASKYQLPENVRSVSESYLFDPLPDYQLKPGRGSAAWKRDFLSLVSSFVASPALETRFDALASAAALLRAHPRRITLADLARHDAAWQQLTSACREHASEVSFLRYHATVRDLATLLWRLLLTAGALPAADCYHCVCTGYAGLLGALASRRHGVPFLLSEHGVYLKERIEDIRKSTWLANPDPLHRDPPFHGSLGPFKSLWISFFDLLSRIAYSHADHITSLYHVNARLQIEFGADPDKILIIPNGIDTSRFAGIARRNLQDAPAPPRSLTVGFLGRVVPIKDVKTLLHAARLVLNRHPDTRFLVAGPTDEDPDYFAECRALADRLGIRNAVEFPGRIKPDDFLAQSDVVLLTSVSEGLPFAILEASAAGLPVVATDAGACRELLAQPLPEAPGIGPSGIVTEVADPASTAAALIQLADNPVLRRTLGAHGLQRVRAAYRQQDIVRQYRDLYHHPFRSPAPTP